MPASEERETVIRLAPSEPSIAYVWTTEPKYWRKFAKAGYQPLKGSSKRGHFYEIPARMVLIRARVPAKRISSGNRPPARADLGNQAIP